MSIRHRQGHGRANTRMSLPSVMLILFLTTYFTAFSKPETALAFVPTPAILAPVGIVGTGLISGTGTATTVATAAGATVTSVAIAPVAIVAGAAIITGGALYLGWKWFGSDDDNDVSPTDPPGGISGDYVVTSGRQTICWYGSSTNCVRHDRAGINTTNSFLWFEIHPAPSGTSVPPYGFTATSTTGVPCADGGYGGGGSIPTGVYVYYSCPTGELASITITEQISSANQTAQEWFTVGRESTTASRDTVIATVPTSDCEKPNSPIVNVTGTPINYTYNTPNKDLPGIIPPACPEGYTRKTFTTPSTYPNGDPAPSPTQPWQAPVTPSGYPECQQPGSCVLTLTQIHPSTGTVNCTSDDICTGWSQDATEESLSTQPTGSPGTQTQTMPDGTTRVVRPRIRPDGSEMVCKWGSYTIPANECKNVPTERNTSIPVPVGGSGDCDFGWSWNPINWVLKPVKCALKWAFYPSAQAVDGWKTRASSIGTKPPINLIIGGVGYIGSVIDVWETCVPACAGDGTSFAFVNPEYGVSFDPLDSAGDTMQGDPKGQSIYALGQVAIIGGFVWWAWRRVAMSFGGKDTTA